MSEAPRRFEFQAEVKQLLDLMVHSLYSDKDVFLRELISNASDALDKVRFDRLTRADLASAEELHIRIHPDADKRTLSVSDNGIGMTQAEVVENIGTIAKSGTKEFLAALAEAKRKEIPPELIGQFGVGFYSAFMVSERIVLVTRRAGESGATRWESTGDGTYTISDAERDAAGTTVTLHLKQLEHPKGLDPADGEQGRRDYTDAAVIKDIVKRYSDFVAYPIRMSAWRTSKEGSSAAKVLEDETINSMKAIWDRPKSDVSETEYREFYRYISHDYSEPLRTIPVKIEGTFEATALLYIPSKAPIDLYSPEMKRGVQLYVKRVFVMDECRDLMPPHLRFVRGVVDAHDLSLNVSREILQKDRQIQIIRKQLVKKVLGVIEEMKKDGADEYLKFWAEFGAVLKEGFLDYDVQDRDKLLDLVMASSTFSADAPTSLEHYASRMKDGQDAIYFLTAPTKDAAAKSPLLEAFAERGYEVLLFSDPVDEIWLERAPKFKEKPLKSISRGEVKFGSDEERKKEKEELEAKQKEYGDLLTQLRVHLQEEIKEVRLSSRLTTSPVCLVGDEQDLSPRVQKMLEELGQAPPKVKRVLEINPRHPLVPKLQTICHENKADPRIRAYAELLLGQAHLAESGNLPNPAAFSKAVGELMERSV